MIQTFKTRLVAKGFKQRECIDYFDIYVLVARITLIRVFKPLDKVPRLCLSLLVFFIFLLSRDCEFFYNFKSLLYIVRFECVSFLHCIPLFFPT